VKKAGWKASRLPARVLLDDHRIAHAWYATSRRTPIAGWTVTEIRARHAEIVAEMERRGMEHHSPLRPSDSNDVRPEPAKHDLAGIPFLRACKRDCAARGETYVGPEGPRDAKIMIVGESPGEEEVKAKRPFVGTAGHRLMRLLASAGLKREEVYLTNAVKCGNHRVAPEALLPRCRGLLLAEIRALKPQAIVALGALARKALGASPHVIYAPHPVARVKSTPNLILQALRKAAAYGSRGPG